MGGAVHLGETAEERILREVFEETGVRYEIDRPAAVCENFSAGKDGVLQGLNCHRLEPYFLMQPKGSRHTCGNSRNMDGDIEDMVWIPVDAMGTCSVRPAFLKEKLKDILDGSGVLHVVQDGRQPDMDET